MLLKKKKEIGMYGRQQYCLEESRCIFLLDWQEQSDKDILILFLFKRHIFFEIKK